MVQLLKTVYQKAVKKTFRGLKYFFWKISTDSKKIGGFQHPRHKWSHLTIDRTAFKQSYSKLTHSLQIKNGYYISALCSTLTTGQKIIMHQSESKCWKTATKKITSVVSASETFSRKPLISGKVLTSKKYSLTYNPRKRNSGAL